MNERIIEEVKKTYKPYKFTKKKNVMIVDSTSGSFVVKEKINDKVSEAYNYLKSRNFDYFPGLATKLRDDVNVFHYVPDTVMPKEQKALDMMDLVALLHNKTTYYKEITPDRYKEIYDNLNNNILYMKSYYDNIYTILIDEIYMSPSHYLLMRNIYKIFAAIDFCKNELDSWYEVVKSDVKTRVAFVHNNLETDHFIKNTKDYLISWENAKIDSPILDLVVFYQKEYMNLNFETLLERYLKNYPLQDSEKKLFYIVISIPPVIKLEDDEMKATRNIRKKLDYIFKTESLVQKLFVSGEDK